MRYVEFLLAALLAFFSFTGVPTQAQQAVEPTSPDKAASPDKVSTLELDLSDVAIFKASSSEEGKVVISLAGSTAKSSAVTQIGYRTEARTRSVPVTRMRAETRVRKKANDKQVEETYVVQVPYTEMVTQSYTVQVPVSKTINAIGSEKGKTKARFVNADSLTAWDLTGKPISQDQLKSRLKKPLTAFLIKRPFGPNVKINSAHRAVLRDDVMLIRIKESK